ncbi:hypothetical protein COCVIDRAFT_114745, partial [Bipolaris victoriae FI3]
FKLTIIRVIIKSIYPYILITSSPTISYFSTISRIVIILWMAAILRRSTIS